MPPFVRKSKQPTESLLFHPKKKPGDRTVSSPQRPTRPPQSPLSKPSPSAKSEPDADTEDLKLPTGTFQEFKLMSSALNGWKYDVMKFDSRKPIDISAWAPPIKLNRKDLRREDRSTIGSQPIPVSPMLGPDGKPVIGPDGKVVMLDAEGRLIQSGGAEAGGNGSGKDKGKANGVHKKKFQKKTRQVFFVPEATRQLRKEERYPWVIEDASGKEVWVGKLEDLSKSETHAFFMPAANDVFKFVPAHRWYKFQKKPSYHIPNLEEAESLMAMMKKNKDPERWLLHNRNARGISSATAAVLKAEVEGRLGEPGSSQAHTSGQSLGPGGRKLKSVDKGPEDLFGDEDEDGNVKRKIKKEEEEGDIDEVVYNLEFTDDEEKVEDDGDEEEAKALEARLKREYKSANKQRDAHIVESDEESNGQLTKDGKAMKKLIRNLEKNVVYESDEEKNPYASSEEEEEEEPLTPPDLPAINPPSRSDSQAPSKPTPSHPQTRPGSRAPSRATSPTPTSPPKGGHSVVAKRATSPKPPKPAMNGVSLSNGSIAGQKHRATSPNGVSTSRQGSPVAQNLVNKRKASEDAASGRATSPTGPPKPKKRKSQGAGAVAIPTGALEDKMVIEWLKVTPNATTRDCIQYFTPYLTDETKKSRFTALVKEVAQLKGGVLVLRNTFRGESGESPPAPAASDAK